MRSNTRFQYSREAARTRSALVSKYRNTDRSASPHCRAMSAIFVFSIPFSRKQSRAFSVTNWIFFSRCSSCGKCCALLLTYLSVILTDTVYNTEKWKSSPFCSTVLSPCAGNRLSWPAVNAAEFHNFLMVSKYPLQPWFSVMKSPC